MRVKQVLQLCLMLLGVTLTAAMAQPRPCSTIPSDERASARAAGACRDVAPIIDVAPKAQTAPAGSIAVPNVVGLNFDDARDRLARFSLQRSYRASGEPGGTVLAQQPAPPARLPAGFPVTVVLSDGTLRPRPRVPASEIDGALTPQAANPDLLPQPSIAADDARPDTGIVRSPAAGGPVQPNSAAQPKASVGRARVGAEVERLVVPNVLGMTIDNAHSRLGRFKVERTYRPSGAESGRVVAQIPQAPARADPGSTMLLVVSSGPARAQPRGNAGAKPVTETFELPDVTGRSYADASGALTEFKVDGIEIASAAPSGEVLAQDPAAGTSMPAGSAVRLQVSDGSLASAAVTAPSVVPAPAAAPSPAPATATATATAAPDAPPVQRDPFAAAFPSNQLLVLIAGVLLGLVLGALLMRRWLLNRQPTIEIEPTPALQFSPAESDVSVVPVPETPPEIRFSAHLDAGETTIEFIAPSEVDAATMESSDHHA